MENLVDFLLQFYGTTHYFILFGVLLLCGMGLPIPEDITLLAGGLLAYYGITSLPLTILVCFLGVMVGDGFVFWLGAKYGKKLTRKWIFHKLLPDDRLEYVQKQIKAKGNRLVFAGRFMPGLRTPIFFTAGSLHLPYTVFLLYDGLAALVSVPTIIGAVYYFGDAMAKVVKIVKHVEHGILFVILSVVLLGALKWWFSHRKLQRQKRAGKKS